MNGMPGALTNPELEIEIRPLADGPDPLLAEMPMAAALMVPWLSIVMLPPAAENAVTPAACMDVTNDVDRSVALMLPLPLLYRLMPGPAAAMTVAELSRTTVP